MAIMQPQRKPRGIAWELSKAIAIAINRENKKRNGNLAIHHILRALEWTRYNVTEATIKATGTAVDP